MTTATETKTANTIERIERLAQGAEKGMARVREDIANNAAKNGTEKLLDQVIDLAVMEVRFRVFHTAVLVARSEGGLDAITWWLQNELLTRVDDQWSGRRNDFRREQHDAKLEALSTIANIVRFTA